jgi:hypothetical protein
VAEVHSDVEVDDSGDLAGDRDRRPCRSAVEQLIRGWIAECLFGDVVEGAVDVTAADGDNGGVGAGTF